MKLQNLILVIIIVLILLVIILGIILLNKRIEDNGFTFIEEPPLVKTLEPVKVRNSYYAVQECTNKYFIYYSQLFNINEEYYKTDNQEEIREAEKLNVEILYNVLDKEYIEGKNVTKDNLKTKLSEIKNCIVDITEMYVSQAENNMEIYVVKGLLKERISETVKEFQIIVKIDITNTTFSILPQEFVEEKYNDLTVGEEIAVQIPESIQKNKNNTFKYNSVSDETYVKDLFSKFKNEIVHFKDIAYNKLDKEYRDKKIKTFNEFEEYIENNKERYSQMQIEQYKKDTTQGYTQYIIMDKNWNYYIFKENSMMDYSIILDAYTIDLPDFLEKYDNATEQQKVALNIDKFIQAVNAKDYNYAYNCLADSFKNNYFKTQAEFETYIKANFYETNSVTYNNFEKQGELFTYTVTITDKETFEQKTKTFIMQLGEGTEFVLSFDR